LQKVRDATGPADKRDFMRASYEVFADAASWDAARYR
jgi:hypothetical protein